MIHPQVTVCAKAFQTYTQKRVKLQKFSLENILKSLNSINLEGNQDVQEKHHTDWDLRKHIKFQSGGEH
jgi:hypothetical protein